MLSQPPALPYLEDPSPARPGPSSLGEAAAEGLPESEASRVARTSRPGWLRSGRSPWLCPLRGGW